MGTQGRYLNVLEADIISVGLAGKINLPGLFARMARGEQVTFSTLRPHQRPAWHMFCVQLAALALWHGQRDTPPDNEGEWRDLLRGLTIDFPDDEPWCMVVEDHTKPAFLQPPDPGGLKWKPVPTPDALDMLITARNHDLKQQVMHWAEAEDWLFALVSLQTMEGYGGKGNNAVARMNGGSSSRVMLGLAPRSGDTTTPDAGSWWQRDLQVLIVDRQTGGDTSPCLPGGKALLWTVVWQEGAQLDIVGLDPWFIEVCRRIQLGKTESGLVARRSTSSKARIDAKTFAGVVGDPWAPVHRTEGKSLTLGERAFSYKMLCDLIIGGDWMLPLCVQPLLSGQSNVLLIAEAFSRGNSKTDGFQSRTIPIPGGVVERFGAPEMKELAEAQMAEIKLCDVALRNGLALLAANGVWEKVKKEHYALTRSARATLDRHANQLFFPALWVRVSANAQSNVALEAAKNRFKTQLARAALKEFTAALPSIPCASIFRPRAEARAQRAFFGSLKKAGFHLHNQEERAIAHI